MVALGFLLTAGTLVVVPSVGSAALSVTLLVNASGTETAGCTYLAPCQTIQDAVTYAQTAFPSDTAITIDVAAGTYPESVAIDVTSSDTLTIQGAGPSVTTVDDGGSGSDFAISAADEGAVAIDGFTITGGAASIGGGGVDDQACSACVPNPTSLGTVTLDNDNISGDTAQAYGGGVDNVGPASTLDLNNDTISDDSAPCPSNCFGGGVANEGIANLTNDTISGDSATTAGGGIEQDGDATLANVTISGNSVSSGHGGGIDADGVWTQLTNVTITGNSAAAGGGLYSTPFRANLANSLLAGNATGGDCAGTSVPPVTDDEFNVADDASCGFGPQSVSNSTTIGPLRLAANGSTGPQTEAITASSSAFNEVPLSACTLATDERGFPRPGVGPNCDAGAFELQPSYDYDLVGADGGVFAFPTGRSTGYYGSLPGLGVNVSNIVGIVATNHDTGYDLVGSDGGVFTFPTGQSTGYYGSLPGLGIAVNDIVGIVATPGGGGYFLVGRDGGIFTFGEAPFEGSLPQSGISVDDITGIASTPDGKGYWVVGANGAVYAFGDATFAGSLPGLGVSVDDIVSIVSTPNGAGYWLIGADGGVFAFGDATAQGSLPGLGVSVDDIVGAVPAG